MAGCIGAGAPTGGQSLGGRLLEPCESGRARRTLDKDTLMASLSLPGCRCVLAPEEVRQCWSGESLCPQTAFDGLKSISVWFAGLANLKFSLLHTPILLFPQSASGWQEVAAVTSKVRRLPPDHLIQTSLISLVSCLHLPSNT